MITTISLPAYSSRSARSKAAVRAAPELMPTGMPSSRAARRAFERAHEAAMGAIDVMDPTSDLSRFEDRIKKEEALVQGRTEARATSLEDQFAELDGTGNDAEIEARLAALKGQGGTPA